MFKAHVVKKFEVLKNEEEMKKTQVLQNVQFSEYCGTNHIRIAFKNLELHQRQCPNLENLTGRPQAVAPPPPAVQRVAVPPLAA
jgi:hypothetical protein